MMEMRGSQKWGLRFATIRRRPRLGYRTARRSPFVPYGHMHLKLRVMSILNISNMTSTLPFIPVSPYQVIRLTTVLINLPTCRSLVAAETPKPLLNRPVQPVAVRNSRYGVVWPLATVTSQLSGEMLPSDDLLA
jgi:hypothetical protein